MGRDLRRLLSPASIAVVGGEAAAAVARQCDRFGFRGEIWPVNPNRERMEGRACFGSVDALPEAPDAAFVALPAEASVDVVGALAQLGAGGTVCYASGFAEAGPDGTLRQERLIDAAGSMPVLGPNCYGLINAINRVALWPDEHGCRPAEGGVALITQSGNIALNLSMARRGLTPAYIIDVGNQAVITIEDVVEALLDDGKVPAIGMHLESITDGVRFGQLAHRALVESKPLVVLKTGVTTTGAEINRSHTAAIAGTDAAYQALFNRYGVGRAHTLPELFDALNVLTVAGALNGTRLVSASCSGGEASLVADRSKEFDVEFPPFDSDQGAATSSLSAKVAVSNPLDYHTYDWGNRTALTATFTAMLDGPFDAGLLVLDVPSVPDTDATSWRASAEAITDARIATQTPAIAVATLSENMNDAFRSYLHASGVPVVHGIDEAFRAVEIASLLGRRRAAPPSVHSPPLTYGSVTTYGESQSKQILTEAGIATPPGRLISRARAADAAIEVGFPVVVKVTELAHKTESGAVVVGLEDGAAVAEAVAGLPEAGDVVVEAMIEDVVGELLVGVRVEPGIGLLLTMASGGTLVELLDDAAHLLLPVGPDDIAAAIATLRGYVLLNGYRGRPPGDVEAAVDTIWTVTRLAEEIGAVELEINPLLVMSEGKGVVAADARIDVGVAP